MTDVIRKNFAFSQKTAEHLELLAEQAKKSMTAILQELIEEQYQKVKQQQRLEALNALKGMASGTLKERSIQSIKAQQNV